MNEPQTFRSAFNGFHREDVVNHIAYMTTKRDSQLKELRSENDSLRTSWTSCAPSWMTTPPPRTAPLSWNRPWRARKPS